MHTSLEEFCQLLVETGEIIGSKQDMMTYFDPAVLDRWLEDHQWLQNPESPCNVCNRSPIYSERQCLADLVANYRPCYRDELAAVFFPLIRRGRNGQWPSVEESRALISKGRNNYGGIGEVGFIGMIFHELGGTRGKMSAEEYHQRNTRA